LGSEGEKMDVGKCGEKVCKTEKKFGMGEGEIGVGQKAGVQGFDVAKEDEEEGFAIAS